MHSISSPELQERYQLYNNTLYSSHDDIFVKLRMPNGKVKEKRIWLINAYTGISGKRYDGSNILKDKVIGAKILNKASARNWKDMYNFYQRFYEIHSTSKFEIASDACNILRRVAKGVPNSTLILSKFHATQPIFTKNNYATNRRWTKKVSKEEMGYYDYLNGDTEKIVKFYQSHSEMKTGKTLLTLVKNNHGQMQNWKTATYGNNAESMASEVKKLLGKEYRIMSEEALLNMLKLRGIVILS